MKKILFTIVLSLMLMPALAQQVGRLSYLQVDTMWIQGNHVANANQYMHIVVTNRSNTYLNLQWELLSVFEGNDTPVLHGGDGLWYYWPGETQEIVVGFRVPKAGHYRFYAGMWKQPDSLLTGHNCLEATFFEQYEKPQLRITYSVNMSTNDGGQQHSVYGNRISGTVTVTNEGTQPYWDMNGLGMRVALNVPDDPSLIYNEKLLTYHLEPRDTLKTDFCFDVRMPERFWGKERELSIVYSDEHGPTFAGPTFRFVMRQATNTYWTADGQVHDLPAEAGQVLRIPAEALAVDLRGNAELYSIDASGAAPNCLFYLDDSGQTPLGLGDRQIVIRDYKLNSLVVNERHAYFCPMPFDVKTALFTCATESNEDGSCSGTLVLPFDAQQVWLTAVNPALESATDISRNLDFYRFEGNNDIELNFSNVLKSGDADKRRLNAYEPYIYFCRVQSPMAFFAEDITIPATREAVACGEELCFAGTTTGCSAANTFRWNSRFGFFGLCETEDTVSPFRAVIRFHGNEEQIGSEQPTSERLGHTSILYANYDDKDTPHVTKATTLTTTRQPAGTAYTLGGQRVDAGHLKPGLYIIGRRKVVIK